MARPSTSTPAQRTWLRSADIDRHFTALRRAHLRELQAQLTSAVARAKRGGSSVPDGYPSGGDRPGGRGGGSSVEAAVAARTRVSDAQCDVYAASAQQHLVAMARHLEGLEGALRLIDHLVGRAPVVPAQCEWCTEVGERVDADHYGSVGGSLAQATALCSAHYQFVVKWRAKPTPEQSRQHSRTGRWRVRVRV